MQIILAWPACTPPLICNFYFGKWLLGPSVFQYLKENMESCICPGVPSRKQVGGSASAEVTALCSSKKGGVTKLPVPQGGVGCWCLAQGARELLVALCLPGAAVGRVPRVPQGVWGPSREAGAAPTHLATIPDTRWATLGRMEAAEKAFLGVSLKVSVSLAANTGFGRGKSTLGPRRSAADGGKVMPGWAGAAALLWGGSYLQITHQSLLEPVQGCVMRG